MTNTIQTIDHVIDIEENQYYIKAPGVESVAMSSDYKPSAGAKGWYIKSWESAGIADTFDMELVEKDGTVPGSTIFAPYVEQGVTKYVILSAKATFSANYALEVRSIRETSTCKLRVKYTENFKIILDNASSQGQSNWDPAHHLSKDPVKGYVWKPSQPDAGTVEIGSGAMSIGSNNKANEWGSFAAGDENEVDGRYALAIGQNNKVAYSAAAIGHGNNVYGYDAIAVGQLNTLRNWRTSAFGEGNSMSAKNGFVSGRQNWVNQNAHEGISVRGVCAVKQTDATYIDIVGAGTDSTHQKNAYALKPDGEIRVGGDIYVKCNDDSSGGTKIRPEPTGAYNSTPIISGVVSTTHSGGYVIALPTTQKWVCVIAYASIPRPTPATAVATYRMYVNTTSTVSPAYSVGNLTAVGTSVAGTSVAFCNARAKFDCSHDILERESSFQNGLGGYGTKSTYTGYNTEPVFINSNNGITSIMLYNQTSPNQIPVGTKYKIYGY